MELTFLWPGKGGTIVLGDELTAFVGSGKSKIDFIF